MIEIVITVSLAIIIMLIIITIMMMLRQWMFICLCTYMTEFFILHCYRKLTSCVSWIPSPFSNNFVIFCSIWSVNDCMRDLLRKQIYKKFPKEPFNNEKHDWLFTLNLFTCPNIFCLLFMSSIISLVCVVLFWYFEMISF